MVNKGEPSRRLPSLVIPVAAGVGLGLAAVPLTWWAVGDLSTDSVGQALGPFHVPLATLHVLAIIVVVVAAVSLAAIARASRDNRSASAGLSKVSTALLIAAGVLTAAGGRFVTRGQSGGADIGVGFLLLLGPVLIVAMLVVAAAIQLSYRRNARRAA